MSENQMQVDMVDRIPETKLDTEKIIKLCLDEKRRIDEARSSWYQKKLEWLHQWDEFTDYDHAPIIKSQQFIHIPVTFEKIQTWHSRMYKTLFSSDPFFHIEPLSKVTKNEVDTTRSVLRWYLRDEINYKEGLKPVIDELLWDLGTDGWGTVYKRWEKIHRVSFELERINQGMLQEEVAEAGEQIRRRGRPKKVSAEYQEIKKIVEAFSGVVIETLPHECVYFPEDLPTSGDLNRPKMVMLEVHKSEQELKLLKEQKFYDAAAVDKVLARGKGREENVKKALRDERARLAGINVSPNVEDDYEIYIVFLREDLDDDGYPEEYVLSVSLKAKQILRHTYLDRTCKDGNRPVYKFDLIKRPRSAYSRGFVEILYSLNQEVDDYHNIRRASGLIANVPWGFYRASSGLDKEPIEISPGKFFPVDDPQTDVAPMNKFGNVTSWALQEEQLSQSYADRLTSMPSMLQGQLSGPIGPLRSTSGMNSLIQESQAPLDVYLDRFRIPFGKLMKGILFDLQTRLPEIIKIKVLGEKGELLYHDNGQLMMQEVPKLVYMGDYKFNLAANDAQYNPERDKQNAMLISQMLMTQFPIQTGIVTPANAYAIYRNLLEKSGELDPDAFITRPQQAPSAMTLVQEYVAVTNGRVPMIVLNDDHKSKIVGLSQLMQSPEYQEGKTMGAVHPLADTIMAQVIQTHMAYLQVISQMPAMPNQSGMETGVTMGGRQSGIGPGQSENMDQGGGPAAQAQTAPRQAQGGNNEQQAGSAQPANQ